MNTAGITASLARLFAELVDGTEGFDGGYIVNTGDIGLVKSLDKLSAADASRSTNGGATIAAHVQHERYGLSLMNEWASHGGNPFANAKWDEAWKVAAVDAEAWTEIRKGLREEAQRWLKALAAPRERASSWISCTRKRNVPRSWKERIWPFWAICFNSSTDMPRACAASGSV